MGWLVREKNYFSETIRLFMSGKLTYTDLMKLPAMYFWKSLTLLQSFLESFLWDAPRSVSRENAAKTRKNASEKVKRPYEFITALLQKGLTLLINILKLIWSSLFVFSTNQIPSRLKWQTFSCFWPSLLFGGHPGNEVLQVVFLHMYCRECQSKVYWTWLDEKWGDW